jgi:hypothetical protein
MWVIFVALNLLNRLTTKPKDMSYLDDLPTGIYVDFESYPYRWALYNEDNKRFWWAQYNTDTNPAKLVRVYKPIPRPRLLGLYMLINGQIEEYNGADHPFAEEAEREWLEKQQSAWWVHDPVPRVRAEAAWFGGSFQE